MNEFKSVILGICIASVGLGAMYMLRPEGATVKAVRFAFAVIFLTLTVTLIVSLFAKGERLLPSLSGSYEFISAEAIAKIEAEQLTREVLKEKGIKYDKIEIFTNKDDGGGISIKRITVKTSENPEYIRDSITAVIKADGVEVINE